MRHGLEGLERVERQRAVERSADRQRVDGQQHRVAIRRRFGDRVGTKSAAGAGAMLDQHRLSDPFGQLVAEDTRHRVDTAARRERHNDADGSRRIALAEGFTGKAEGDEPDGKAPSTAASLQHSLDAIPGTTPELA